MTDPAPLPADLVAALGDRYRLEREVGAGGMATVYLAQDVRHHRPVAIKVLKPALTAVLGPDRFLQEISLAARLQHPNIVALIDSGECDGVLYYIMPFVGGESLRQRLTRSGRLPLTEALRLTAEIAEALAFAHRSGVIHRDVKPENILLHEGHALVADFGIALALRQAGDQRLTQTGYSLGTPAYMSPEQVTGTGDLDGRSDQYALACLLHEMLTGAPPFSGPSPQAVMVKQVTDPAPGLEAPEPVAAAVARALSKEPTARFDSLPDFVAALGRVDTPPGQGTIAAGPTTVAVLPFANRSPDADTEYFSDGISDEVISDLAKVRAIRVISRVSAGRYKGTDKDVTTIARELGVRYVVTGTVRRAGDSLRITAELVDSQSGAVLWSEKLAGTMADVFDVQERLSRQVVDALAVTVTPDESRRMAARPMQDVKAYECYLRARAEIYRFDPEALGRARAMVYQAMALVGENAHLHATLSFIHWMSGILGLQLDESSVAIGHAHADRAIALGPEVAQGYSAKAFMSSKGHQGGIAPAIPWLERALALERDPDALIFAAWFHGEFDGSDEAAAFGAEVALVDPFNWFAHAANAVALLFGGRSADALKVAARIGPMDPDNYVAVACEGMLRIAAGDRLGGRGRLADAVTLVPPDLDGLPVARAIHAFHQAASGRASETAALIDPSVEEYLASDDWLCCWGVWIHGLIGNGEGVLRWLGHAIARGVVNVRWWSELDPIIGPWRDDPRFEALMEEARRHRVGGRSVVPPRSHP